VFGVIVTIETSLSFKNLFEFAELAYLHKYFLTVG